MSMQHTHGRLAGRERMKVRRRTQVAENRRDATVSDRVLALIMIAIGSGAIYFARDISPMAKVFPVTMAVVLLLLSGVLLAKTFVVRSSAAPHEVGSVPRRLALILVILAWGFTLNWLGFLLSSAIGVGLLAAVGHFDGWGARRTLGYGLALLGTIAFFYVLFAILLDVPLPTGSLWVNR